MTAHSPRLIMVVPASPGAGKSTMAYGLFEQLRLQGVPVEWFYEEDVFQIEALWRFAGEMERGDPASLASFREGARALIDRFLDAPGIHITDSFLPGFFWLRHLYPREAVREFARELWEWVAALHPVIVYCQADPQVAFERAVRQRGVAWGEGILQRLREWTLSEYPGRPIRTTDDMYAFFSWLDSESRELLREWPGETVVVDTMVTPPAEAVERVLSHLGLASQPVPRQESPADLTVYTGVYVPAAASSERDRVVIDVRGGSLFATLYWPDGSRLIQEGLDLFRLQATNRMVRFRPDDTGRVNGFEYEISWKGTESYVRADERTTTDP